jgi:hypothetical protein
MVGLRHRRCAWLVMLWLLGAALLAPLTEVGDLLESVVTVPVHPHWVAMDPDDPLLQGHAHERCPGAPADAPGMTLARYVMAVGPKADLGPALEPLFRLRDEPHAGPHAVAAGWRDLERGPPLSL